MNSLSGYIEIPPFYMGLFFWVGEEIFLFRKYEDLKNKSVLKKKLQILIREYIIDLEFYFSTVGPW